MFKLADGRGGSEGLYCGRDGVFLGSAALIEHRDDGYWLRADDEVAALLSAAYESPPDLVRFLAGLRQVGAALEEDNLAQAMIAAVQLGLAAIPERKARTVTHVDELSKYNFNPLEPRDWHGHWTSEGAEDVSLPAGSEAVSAPRLVGFDGDTERSPTLQVSARTVSGVASWYNLLGHQMANGKVFDPNAMNAAVLKVPLGTVVTV